MTLEVSFYTRKTWNRTLLVADWSKVDYRNNPIVIHPIGGGLVILPRENLDHMTIEKVEEQPPTKKPEGKCRSCKHDMSDDSTTLRTKDCPDNLDGEIMDGCDKYERK